MTLVYGVGLRCFIYVTLRYVTLWCFTVLRYSLKNSAMSTWAVKFEIFRLIRNFDKSTCAVKFEILGNLGRPGPSLKFEFRLKPTLQNFDMSNFNVRSELGYHYLTRLLHYFTVFYVTLRYFIVFYCFSLRIQISSKFRHVDLCS